MANIESRTYQICHMSGAQMTKISTRKIKKIRCDINCICQKRRMHITVVQCFFVAVPLLKISGQKAKNGKHQ